MNGLFEEFDEPEIDDEATASVLALLFKAPDTLKPELCFDMVYWLYVGAMLMLCETDDPRSVAPFAFVVSRICLYKNLVSS